MSLAGQGPCQPQGPGTRLLEPLWIKPDVLKPRRILTPKLSSQLKQFQMQGDTGFLLSVQEASLVSDPDLLLFVPLLTDSLSIVSFSSLSAPGLPCKNCVQILSREQK